jgi:MFS family permease
VLFVVAFCAIIPDLSSAWGVPLIVPMAAYWPDTTDNVGRSLSGNVFVRPPITILIKMLGVGGLIAVPFTQRFGRLPVLWWSMFLSLFMTLFATLASSNTSFIVARCLMGLFTTPPQCIGLSFIHDMYPPPKQFNKKGSTSTNTLEKSEYGPGHSSSHLT